MDIYKRKKEICTTWDEMEGSESDIDSDEEEAMLITWPLKTINMKMMKVR